MPARLPDLTGQTFNYLTAVEKQGRFYLCKCRCGAEVKLTPSHLHKGVVKSCGCIRKKIHIKAGDVFGMLTVKNAVGADWNCLCQCGITKVFAAYQLKGGTYSCGCRGQGRQSHGLSHTNAYRSWQAMKSRCDDPSNKFYADYGGRGITYAAEWADFETFYDDLGERKSSESLDRMDAGGNYTPDNCQWLAKGEQQRNTRKTITIKDAQGKKWHTWELAEASGLAIGTVRGRIYRNWTVEQILNTPAKV